MQDNTENAEQVSQEEKPTLKERIKNVGFIKKIRSIKHIEYIIAIILIGIIVLIFFNNFGVKKDSTAQKTSSTYITLEQYAEIMQSELSSILSKIKGAGSVSVMITFNSSAEKIPAYNVEQTGGNLEDSIILNKKPIVVNGEVLILKELKPEVRGVVIVASGGKDARVKFELKSATKTLLDISYDKIEIFTMK